MPAWTARAWTPRALTASALTGRALGAPAEAVNPFASLADDFTGDDDEPALTRGWSYYKADAILMAEVQNNRLRVLPVQGGGGDYQGGGAVADASFWYTQSNTDQRDGLLVYKAIGPAVGTPVGFDARARFYVTNEAGDDLPPAVVGEWRFACLAVHHPTRTNYLRYLHIGLGSEGGAAVVGIEVKVNRVNATGGASVLPVTAIDTTGLSELAYDLRIERRASDPDLYDIHSRPVSSGEALTSNVGWTLHDTVRWTDGEDADDTFDACPQETDTALPDDVHVGIANYSNATVVDLRVDVDAFVVLPSAA